MNKAVKEFMRYALLPIGILAMLLLLILVFQLFDLPTYSEIVAEAKNLFAEYGYWVIFMAAIAEGLLLANWYLPGSVVVVMGAILAMESGQSPVWAVLVIILGFFLTTLFNYFLGRYGWYKLLLKFGLKEHLDKASNRLEKHGPKVILASYFHPNVGAFTATGAGILKLNFWTFLFYSVIALFFWNAFWGTVVVLWGPSILDIITYQNLLIVLGVWIVGMLGVFVWKRWGMLGEPII
jgi:membrane-associated protein